MPDEQDAIERHRKRSLKRPSAWALSFGRIGALMIQEKIE